MKIFRDIIACIVVGLFMAFALLGFFYQCGESYVDAKGVRHVVECRPLWGGEEEQDEKR